MDSVGLFMFILCLGCWWEVVGTLRPARESLLPRSGAAADVVGRACRHCWQGIFFPGVGCECPYESAHTLADMPRFFFCGPHVGPSSTIFGDSMHNRTPSLHHGLSHRGFLKNACRSSMHACRGSNKEPALAAWEELDAMPVREPTQMPVRVDLDTRSGVFTIAGRNVSTPPLSFFFLLFVISYLFRVCGGVELTFLSLSLS